MSLADRKCVPCRGGVPPLTPEQIAPLRSEVPAWEVVRDQRLVREFRFRDFAWALQFVNRIGALAEEEGHHPELLLGYGRVRVEMWTHKIDGLTESDFILVAKVDRLWQTAGGRVL